MIRRDLSNRKKEKPDPVQKDQRIKKAVFPASAFVLALLFLAAVTTLQMKIIGDYISFREIPFPVEVGIFIFWFLGAVAFTLFTSWQIRKKYTEPLEEISDAARRVAEGDFSVYVRPRHTNNQADCLDVLVQDFNKMVEELGSIETLKTDFFSNVSHEFKTPLAVICSNAQMLQREDLSADQQEAVNHIADSGKRMSDLVQNMLKLNKLEKQEILPAAEPYDVCAQLSGCAVQFEESWEEKNIEFNADMEDRAILTADPGLMELVWNNLLSNAVKYTGENGRITLRETSDEDYIRVSVADSGCGMSEEEIRHIFDKFYQADTSHAASGNGLGLALVRRILELMDAEIRVDSTPGRGSVFTVILKR